MVDRPEHAGGLAVDPRLVEAELGSSGGVASAGAIAGAGQLVGEVVEPAEVGGVGVAVPVEVAERRAARSASSSSDIATGEPSSVWPAASSTAIASASNSGIQTVQAAIPGVLVDAARARRAPSPSAAGVGVGDASCRSSAAGRQGTIDARSRRRARTRSRAGRARAEQRDPVAQPALLQRQRRARGSSLAGEGEPVGDPDHRDVDALVGGDQLVELADRAQRLAAYVGVLGSTTPPPASTLSTTISPPGRIRASTSS